MKKSALLTALLLALSVAGIFMAHRAVNRAKDAVVLTGTALFGEPEKARGLTVALGTTVDHHLFWDTRLSMGEKPETATAFKFYPQRQEETYEPRYGGVYFELYTDFNGSSTGAIDDSEENLYGMDVVYRAVTGRTGAGQEHSEIIRLGDYFEFYPLNVTLDLPVSWQDPNGRYQELGRRPWGNRDEYFDALSAFFRIPVEADHKIEVHVRKNAAGQVNGWGMGSMGGGVSLWTQSALTDMGCYFTFNNRADDGGLVDTSHIPGGYGIYFLPYKTEGEHWVADPDGLSMVYPLNPQGEVLKLYADAGQKRLLLLTREDGDCVLTVIEIDTMETLQRLTVLEDIGDQWFTNIYFENDLLVPILGDNRFAVVWSQGGGDFEIQFLAEYVNPDEDTHYLKYDAVMAWDGRRLALATETAEPDFMQSGCGFYLALYDKTGLTYAAFFDSSLDAATALDYQYRCRPLDNRPLKLRFD